MTATGQSYFDNNYTDYERQNSPAKLRFYLNVLAGWLPAGARVFELGVGLGLFLREAQKQFRLSGCDINEYALEQTRLKAPGIALYQGSYEVIPAGEGWDGIVAWDVMEHISQLDEALSIIYQRLKPGGIFAGVVPVYDGPLGGLVRRLDKDPTHIWKLSRQAWRDKLTGQGFTLVDYGGILRKLVGQRYIHVTQPRWLWRPCGVACYWAARKG